jgi:hypothetical protein
MVILPHPSAEHHRKEGGTVRPRRCRRVRTAYEIALTVGITAETWLVANGLGTARSHYAWMVWPLSGVIVTGLASSAARQASGLRRRLTILGLFCLAALFTVTICACVGLSL